MISLTNSQIKQLIDNMLLFERDGDVRTIALGQPENIEFRDERGHKFTAATVRAIHAEAARRTYYCGVCDTDKPISGWDADSNGCDLCSDCYEYAGWENTHSDNDHERSPDPACPVCQEVAA